ncbi:MAG: hypothetical protein HUJ96_01925 [Marinilabiliaceae bacterium]|nr:hypothetical protein [Marinilabiliaceae bacterium]
MIKLFLFTLALIAIALVLFGIQILLKKNGKFSSQHVGQSKAMRDRGIHCIQAQDRIARASKNDVTDFKKYEDGE